MQRAFALFRPITRRVTVSAGFGASQCSRRFSSGEAAGKGSGAHTNAGPGKEGCGATNAGAQAKPHPTQNVSQAGTHWNNQLANKATVVLLTVALAAYVYTEVNKADAVAAPKDSVKKEA